MLSVEEIKKACEFADGFELANTVGDKELWLDTGRGTVIGTRINENNKQWNLVYYPLFLQRVIEGINKEYRKDDKGYCVAEYISFLSVYHGKIELRETEHFYSDFETIDQAKEQAIKYVLDKI